MRDTKAYPPEEQEPWYPEAKTRKRRKRIRTMTLAQAIKAARKAGLTSATVSVGDAKVEFGNNTTTTNENSLDGWMRRHAH